MKIACRLLTLSLCALSLGGRPAAAVTIDVPAVVATIHDALAQAIDGDVVQLAPGHYHEKVMFTMFTARVVLRGDPSNPGAVILDGDGQPGDAVVTMVDAPSGTVLEGVTITGGAGGDVVAGGLFFANSAAIVRDCIITGNSSGIAGGVYVLNSSGSFQRVVVSGNTARGYGGAMMVNTASTTVFEDCEFNDNVAGTVDTGAGSGGAILINDSSPTFVGCSIANNVAPGSGGGVTVYGHLDSTGSHVVFRSCVLANNVAIPGPAEFGPPEGGGINIEDDSEVVLDRCLVHGNVSERGGGVNVFRGSYVIRDSIIEDNQAIVTALGAGTGGGLYSASVNTTATLQGPARVAITGTVFRRNTARQGGGLFVQGDFLVDPQGHKGQLSFDQSLIVDNHASEMGGGIFLAEAEATLQDTSVIGNTLSDGGAPGGGILSSASSVLTLTNCLVAENQAPGQGGGIYADQSGSLTVTGSRFFRNHAGVVPGGAAIMVGASSSPVAADAATPVSGAVTNSLFAGDVGAYEIYESDCNAPMTSTIIYDDNSFALGAGVGAFFGPCSSPAATATALNLRAKAHRNQAVTADFATLMAVPASIDPERTAVLAYCNTSPNPLAITPTPGAVTGPCGTVDVSPTSTTTYALAPGGASATIEVACAAVGLPIPILPKNGVQRVAPASVSLSWNPASGAASYDVLVDESAEPETVVASGVTDPVFVVSGLANGTTYRWRVRARAPGCDGAVTSPTFEFTTCTPGHCDYFDSFDDGDATDWRLTGRGGRSAAGGALVLAAPKKPIKVFAPADPFGAGTIDLTLSFGPGTRHEAHVLLRANGKAAADIAIYADKNLLRYRGRGGRGKLRGENEVVFPLDKTFRLRIEVENDAFRLLKDGAQVLKGSLAGLRPGAIGFKVVKSTLLVDEIRVSNAE